LTAGGSCAILWRRHGDRVRAAQPTAAAGRAIGAGLIAVGIGEVLVWADASGLWLALIGMFVMSAAAAKATAGTAAAALAGLRACDVMTPDPDIGGAWMSVSDFIDRTALNSAQTGFPVIGPGGSLAGVSGISRLARVRPASRASTTLGQIMTPVPPAYLAASGDPAARYSTALPRTEDLAAIVLSDGKITGIVTVPSLRQIVRREALRASRPR